MKTLKTILFHTVIWGGIYWGAVQSVGPVANLTAVGMALASPFAIAIALLSHYVLSNGDHPNTLAGSICEQSTGSVWSWLFRISSYAQAVALIMIGDVWIIMGTLWLIAVILLDTLVMRAQQINTEAA